MKVYLDDVRETPEGWIRCYWPEEVIEHLKTGKVTHLSLDHDLGEDPRNGYDVILWLEEQTICKGFMPPANLTVHSDNSSAREKMWRGIQSIRRHATGFVE